MKHSKMPNEGKGGYGPGSNAGHNTGACSGLKKSNDQRADVTAPVSNKQPYPKGLS